MARLISLNASALLWSNYDNWLSQCTGPNRKEPLALRDMSPGEPIGIDALCLGSEFAANMGFLGILQTAPVLHFVPASFSFAAATNL